MVVTTRPLLQDDRIEELALLGEAEASAVRKRVKNVEEFQSQNYRIRSMLDNYKMTDISQVNTRQMKILHILAKRKLNRK